MSIIKKENEKEKVKIRTLLGKTRPHITDALKVYLNEISNFPLLSSDEERRLFELIGKDNKKAKMMLINSNLRLVVNIAKKYVRFGVPLLDLIEEGNLGLIRAAEKFNIKRGFRFSTYATWWIKQYIIRALSSQGRSIHLPAHMVELLNKYIKISTQLIQKFGREPTVEEISKKIRLSIKKTRQLIEVSEMPISIELYTPDEDDKRKIEDIIQDKHLSPSELHLTTMQLSRIEQLFTMLNFREREILRLRFGFKDGIPRTLAETGKVFRITRERIRQIELKALRKLRHLARNKERDLRNILALD